MLTQPEIIHILKTYFNEASPVYKIEMVFLYGSWARGFPKKTSDVDVAVVFSEEQCTEDKVFEHITDISFSLTKRIGLEVNVIPIYSDFRKPMLYYNAIVLGIPVFIKDQNKYPILRNEAIYQMEDFTLFGTKWQLEIAKKNLEDIKHA
ncbi:MAG: nucleotidyltransferase domain-containing protein [Planctomycetes bacterium]|nr:nucleotidyltransferase domain-containing protein [Planctomycetota bacterium]